MEEVSGEVRKSFLKSIQVAFFGCYFLLFCYDTYTWILMFSEGVEMCWDS